MGASDLAEHVEVRLRMEKALLEWSLAHHNRITRSDEEIAEMAAMGEPPGIIIGVWDENDYEEHFGKPFGRQNK